MADRNEMTLRMIMQTNKADLWLFFSVMLELVSTLRNQHQNGNFPHCLNPDYITVHSQGGRYTIILSPRSASFPPEGVQALAYISPEQTGLLKRQIDYRSDLYTLGVVCYEWLTGMSPFRADTANEWIHAHTALLPVPPKSVSPEVPSLLSDIVMKLLSKARGGRYQSAYGLHDDLEQSFHQLKKSGMITPFPLGVVDERSRFRLPAKLYGRSNEMFELHEAYVRASSGSTELLLIGGHAGSGKTTLLQAFQPSVTGNNGYFISGKFEQLTSSTPHAPLIEAFRDLIRQLLIGSEAEFAGWKRRLSKALGQNGILLADVIPELTLIVGKQPPVQELSPTESTIRLQLLFSQFIKAFTDRNHPFVIWLDNLQWADHATLDLLRSLVNDHSNKHLLIVGTYRNNEVEAQHPFNEQFIANLHQINTSIRTLSIEALDYRQLSQFVADTLHDDLSRTTPLANILYQKTAGNPFYLKQLLQMYNEGKLIYFSPELKRWEWHLPSIMERHGFQDVNSLLLQRFESLRQETLEALRLAGCIGSSFDIQILSKIIGLEPKATEQTLVPAISAGLILHEDDRYVFVHDQVQKAAYDLISDMEKMYIHREIGRLMHSLYSPDSVDDHLFEIAHHLNLGSGLITDSEEIVALANLNLTVGRKAKASAAYAQALELLDTGARLIAAEGWSRHHELYAQFLIESSECHYYCGYFDQAKQILEQLLAKVTDCASRAQIYVIQISMYAFQKEVGQASAIAIQAMEEFGLSIPSRPSRHTILKEVLLTQWRLAENRTQLTDLPLSQQPLDKALADIVMASSSIVFVEDRELSAILFAKYVRMSLNQGHSDAFAIALGSYAIILALGFKRYKTALRLTKVALLYAEKTDNAILKGKLMVITGLVSQFLRPRDSSQYFKSSLKFSRQSGDSLYAGHAISCELIIGGNDLRQLQQACEQFAEEAAWLIDRVTLKVLRQTKQYVHHMLIAPNSSLPAFNYSDFEEQDGNKPSQHQGNMFYYYTCQLEVYYLYDFHQEALAVAEQSQGLEADMLVLIKQKNCFYYALAMMSVYPNVSDRSKRNDRQTIKQLIARMKQWSNLVPEDTLSKYWILSAEWARLKGEYEEASRLYDRAIVWAREQELAQDEAIANELAARSLLLRNQPHKASQYLQDACRAYFKWGALGKVKSLQKQYAILTTLSLDEETFENLDHGIEHATAVEGHDLHQRFISELDLDTLRQAARIVPGNTADNDLIDGFLDLAIRNAGADKGLILLGIEEAGVIAYRSFNDDSDMDRIRDGARYSPAVVQFAMRTGEATVLANASRSLFAADPYIQRNHLKSILCLPLRFPNDKKGILYLENNLIGAAFSPERIDILEIAFSRMVYGRLQYSNGDNVKASEKHTPGEKHSLIETLSVREVEILRLMAKGLSNQEIAVQLEITEGTVKNHAFNLYGKLQVNRRAQAISKARELQLLD